VIGKDEILSVASETGLRPNVVEKDYVLGWLLAAINANDALSEAWVFKGGTCLKKCYFETYRFSEDLDYTLKDASHLDAEFLKEQFKAIAEWVYIRIGTVVFFCSALKQPRVSIRLSLPGAVVLYISLLKMSLVKKISK